MNNKLQVIDFYATWCGPCKLMTPIFDQLIEEYKDNEEVQVIKYDCDSDTKLTTEYKIRSIPTILFIKDGVEIDRIIGATSKKNILEKIENLK